MLSGMLGVSSLRAMLTEASDFLTRKRVGCRQVEAFQGVDHAWQSVCFTKIQVLLSTLFPRIGD